MRVPALLLLQFAILFAASGATRAEDAGPVAFHNGMKIVRAYTSAYGPDAEEFNEIGAMGADSFVIAYTDTRGIAASRRVLSSDRSAARVYAIGFAANMPPVLPGATSLGVSSAVIDDLRENGTAPVAIMYDTALSTISGTLTLVERNIRLPVLVGTELVDVPVLHATGEFQAGNRHGTGDFYFLDNRNQAIAIQYEINFSWESAPRTIRTVQVMPSASQQAALQQTLETLHRIDLYGIHFDFDKSTIRRESAELITDIAKTLEINPTWTLLIQGHTDSIGDADYNQQLSEQRATAVMRALAERHGVDASRLQSAGLGEAQSVASNDTLQGRALNRRVELVRTDR
jgi:outer membrane protein OmpA-like peptidoglycan-associated protein